jgi:SAM-dependent methyltransferase
MKDDDRLSLFLETVIVNGLYSNKRNLEFHLHQLFNEVDFVGKRVIDIGGGSGFYSFYAATKGASRVVCVEPEEKGSTTNVTEEFRKLSSLLEYKTVFLETVPFQEYHPADGKYDLIFLLNTINHLDETACVDLLKDEQAREKYEELFAKIYQLADYGTTLIVSDCSCRNFFSDIGIKNPFVPTIEWYKHQTPESWIDLLQSIGFCQPEIRWSSFNRLGRVGKLIMSNRLVAYFSHSHFVFTMKKL